MSSLINALALVPIPSYFLGATTLVTAYPFISNVSDYQRGVVALLNGRRGPTYMSARAKARVFSGYFGNAATWIVGSTSAAAVLALTTAYIHPVPLISHLALASGIFSSLQIPATIALGIPKYFGPLIEMDKKDELKDVADGSAKAKEVDGLIKVWEEKHLLRFLVTGPALACAFAAMLLD